MRHGPGQGVLRIGFKWTKQKRLKLLENIFIYVCM